MCMCNVFELDAELELSLLNLVADRVQGLHNLLALGRRGELHLCQHFGVGDRRSDVLGVQAAVEAHAFGKLLDASVSRLGKDTAPRLVGHSHSMLKRMTAGWMHENINCKWLMSRCQTSRRADARCLGTVAGSLLATVRRPDLPLVGGDGPIPQDTLSQTQVKVARDGTTCRLGPAESAFSLGVEQQPQALYGADS